jgi:hypothetical protein
MVDLTFDTMRWLGRSLLFELQMTSSNEIVDELSSLINKMENLAFGQKSFLVLTEVYILKAKLELKKFNFRGFEENLSLAERAAEDRGLTGYLLQIKKERSIFEEQFNEWNRLLKENSSYYDRIKQANLVDYIKSAKRII